jgi:hypothetical protein
MIPEAREVRLRSKERKVLEARCRGPSTPQGEVKRARIVLLAADGLNTRAIAKDAIIAAYNETATPFAWTKKKVYQRRFKSRRITQV